MRLFYNTAVLETGIDNFAESAYLVPDIAGYGGKESLRSFLVLYNGSLELACKILAVSC